jgi:putative nucleotidyltransferase with HDIG domain
MPLELTLEEHEQLAATFERLSTRMTPRERLSEVVVDGGFAIAVALIWWLEPPGSFPVLPATVCFLVMVLATRVRIDTPFGFTVPTQLAFVPLLFAVPVAIVPIAVAAALGLARVPEVVVGKIWRGRLVQVIGNSWFAIGPAAVFAVAATAPRDAGAALLLCALAAQFLVDFTASAIRFRIARGASFSEQVRETWVYGIDAALSGVALVVAEEIHTAPVAALATVPILALFEVFARERHARLQSLLELSNTYRGTALLLADVVAADDFYTAEHSKSVVELSLAVAGAFNLDPERRRNLEFAALLHDIGKIAIPKEIINKPGDLDRAEWKTIKTHTIEGQRMLNRVGGFMSDVGLIARSHHEHWDGSGYPDGLAGEAIPLEARIIACCDAWNAMRTHRPYRKALSHATARADLVANAGSQFDPRVVDVTLSIVDSAARHRRATGAGEDLDVGRGAGRTRSMPGAEAIQAEGSRQG